MIGAVHAILFYSCQALLCNMEEQIERANRSKDEATKEQQRIDTEVANLKKTLKMTGSSFACMKGKVDDA